MPLRQQDHHGLPTISVSQYGPHGLSHRPRRDHPLLQQKYRSLSPTSQPLFSPQAAPAPANFRPPPAFRPINAPSPPPLPKPRSVPLSTESTPEEILTKIHAYTAIHSLPPSSLLPPAPLSHLTWSSISALEGAVLVSIIATLSKLGKAIQSLPASYSNSLIQRLRTAETMFLRVMAPAHVCCEVINEVRDGRWMSMTGGTDNGGRVLGIVIRALDRVTGVENVVLSVDGLLKKCELGEAGDWQERDTEEEWGRWVGMVELYVESVIGSMESTMLAVERERERERCFCEMRREVRDV